MWVTRSVTVALLLLATALPARAGENATRVSHLHQLRSESHQISIREYEAKQRAYLASLQRYHRQAYLAALHAANALKARLAPRPVVVATAPPVAIATAPPVVVARVAPPKPAPLPPTVRHHVVSLRRPNRVAVHSHGANRAPPGYGWGQL